MLLGLPFICIRINGALCFASSLGILLSNVKPEMSFTILAPANYGSYTGLTTIDFTGDDKTKYFVFKEIDNTKL